MAPEMIAGLAVDARTDVFLLGATLHEVLTGTPPHAGQSLATVLHQGYTAAPHEYPDAPEELAALCRQAMSRDPLMRPSSARAFRDELAAFLRHRASAAILKRGRALLAELVESDSEKTTPAPRARLEECLVTLRLALAEWPESPEAIATLGEWRRVALAAAIDEGNIAGAEGLLAEIGDVPPNLTDRLDGLRRRIERARQEADHGRRAAFEGDAGIGARERRLLGVFMAAGVVLVASVAVPYSIRGTLTTGQILRFAVAACVPFALVVVGLRRRLLVNTYARRTVGMLGLIFTLILVHRTVAWLADRPVPETLVADLLVVAGACGVGGIVLARWWYAGLAAGLTGACVGIWNPALAAPAVTSTALVVALAAVVSWSRDIRADER
jgi:serine/threonine-protein kinase